MKYINNFFENNGGKIMNVFITIIIGYLVIKMITFIIAKSKLMKRVDATIGTFFTGLIQFVLYVAYIITILSMIGIPMTTFIAMLSALGLAVALALQGNLSNFASTLMILAFKPFKVGDFIESQNNIGTVKEIQLLFTHILTPDNRKLVVPNSELVNARIINYTAEATRRIDLVFNASYNDDVEHVKSIIKDIVYNHDLILNEPEPIVRLAMHNTSSLDYDVKIWVKKENYWGVRYDLHEQIRDKFMKEGITIPFAQHVVYMNEG